jgi:hypothetical protein
MDQSEFNLVCVSNFTIKWIEEVSGLTAFEYEEELELMASVEDC